MEQTILESAFDKKKKKPGLKFNPGLELTGVRTTGPRALTWDFTIYRFYVNGLPAVSERC